MMKKFLLILMLSFGGFLFSQNCNDTIFVPNAFTPELTTNNTFKPYVYDYDDYHMTIYNRWGYVVYEGKEWDGISNDVIYDRTVFVWVVTAYSFSDDCQRTFNGTVVIIK